MTELGFELGGLAVEYGPLTTILNSLNFNIHMIYISIAVHLTFNFSLLYQNIEEKLEIKVKCSFLMSCFFKLKITWGLYATVCVRLPV